MANLPDLIRSRLQSSRYGVDWAVIGGINSMPALHEYFGFGYSGSTVGLINALMTIGGVCGAPFLGLADVIGRRGVNFAGNVIVVFAALLQAWAVNTSMFMAGRFFMGFGTALISSSQYMAEIAPIHLRGRLVGVFGACFQVGSLGMTGAMVGLTTLSGNYSWRIPLLLQAGLALVVCCTIYLLTPESPRYLVKRGKRDAARNVIAKYHTTSGNIDEPLVGIVVSQIDESLENEKASNLSTLAKHHGTFIFMELKHLHDLTHSWSSFLVFFNTLQSHFNQNLHLDLINSP